MSMSKERPEPLIHQQMSSNLDAYPNAPRLITFEIPPAMFAMLQQLAAASGQPIEGVFDRAIILYKASLDALNEGKHVGVAETSESLETEFVGLIPSGTR